MSTITTLREAAIHWIAKLVHRERPREPDPRFVATQLVAIALEHDIAITAVGSKDEAANHICREQGQLFDSAPLPG